MSKTIVTLFGFLIAGVLLAPGWTGKPNDAFKGELRAMAGTWKVVSIETDGFKVPNFVVTEKGPKSTSFSANVAKTAFRFFRWGAAGNHLDLWIA